MSMVMCFTTSFLTIKMSVSKSEDMVDGRTSPRKKRKKPTYTEEEEEDEVGGASPVRKKRATSASVENNVHEDLTGLV